MTLVAKRFRGYRVSEQTYEIEIEIRNPEGLHMRPAMQFVDLANSFESDISVGHQDTIVDAKSIMQMTVLHIISFGVTDGLVYYDQYYG